MADSDNPEADLQVDLIRWETDHLHHGRRVVVKPGRSPGAKVLLTEFSNKRLEIVYAIQQLEKAVTTYIHAMLDRLDAEIRKSRMPPDVASGRFEQEAQRELKSLEDRWAEKVRKLVIAKGEELDPTIEAAFSANEVTKYNQQFKDFAPPIVEEALNTFKAAMWAGKASNPQIPARPLQTRKDPEGLRRRALVDEYIQEVLRATGKRISRTDIWKTAGYRTRTEFERWERNDHRATRAADQTFIRLLTAEKPHLK